MLDDRSGERNLPPLPPPPLMPLASRPDDDDDDDVKMECSDEGSGGGRMER